MSFFTQEGLFSKEKMKRCSPIKHKLTLTKFTGVQSDLQTTVFFVLETRTHSLLRRDNLYFFVDLFNCKFLRSVSEIIHSDEDKRSDVISIALCLKNN